MTPIRVVLVDDHTVLRAGLRALLRSEPDIVVVGDASTGEEAVELARELRPDVVVMDLSMPGVGGLEATRRITSEDPAVRVLVLTVHTEAECLLPVLEAGGSGYVAKASADHELVRAVRVVAAGDVFLPPAAARLLTATLATPRETREADPLHTLSVREREVLVLTVEGFSASEVGEKLGLSHKTVETYRQRVMDKLGMHHRSELVRFALRHGLLVSAA